MVVDTPGTVTNATDISEWQAHQLPHLRLGMEVTDRDIAMLDGGREGIRTPGLLVANDGENKLRLGATIT